MPSHWLASDIDRSHDTSNPVTWDLSAKSIQTIQRAVATLCGITEAPMKQLIALSQVGDSTFAQFHH